MEVNETPTTKKIKLEKDEENNDLKTQSTIEVDISSGNGTNNVPDLETESLLTDTSESSSVIAINEDPTAISKLFLCPICKKKFLSESQVQVHIFRFHRIPVQVQQYMRNKGGLDIIEIDVD